MPSSSGLTHVAMSVPEGTLTDAYRERLLEFYGRILGWREMEALRRPDRLTVCGRIHPRTSMSGSVPTAWLTHGYEHFGILVGSAEDLRQLWADLANDEDDVELEPLSTNDDGEGSFPVSVSLADGGGGAVLRQSALTSRQHAVGRSLLRPDCRVGASSSNTADAQGRQSPSGASSRRYRTRQSRGYRARGSSVVRHG